MRKYNYPIKFASFMERCSEFQASDYKSTLQKFLLCVIYVLGDIFVSYLFSL